MPCRKFWPATILFNTKELKTYDIWRSLHLLHKPHDRLPTAFEYEDYLHWRYHMQARSSAAAPVASDGAKGKQSDPTYKGYTLAAKCKHPLHPAHPGVHTHTYEGEEEKDDSDVVEIPPRCPKCILTAHMRLLNAIKDRWEERGAPWHPKDGQGETYGEMMKVYHHVKVPLVNAVDLFSEWAKLEVAWETAHLDQDIEVARQFSATRTVEAYVKHATCACPRIDDENWKKMQDAQGKLKKTKNPSVSRPPRRSLSFTPGTPDGSHRKCISYRKLCATPLYAPGAHACRTPEGWADTSFLYSYRYTIAQSRILFVERFTKRPYVTYRNLNCEPFFGDNKHVDRLLHLIDNYMDNLDEEERIQLQDDLAMRTSYVWVVQKESAQNGVGHGDVNREVDEDNKSPEAFTHFWYLDTLLGTELESWARFVGDVTEEEEELWRKQNEAWVQSVDEDVEVVSASGNSSEEGVYGKSDDGREVDEVDGDSEDERSSEVEYQNAEIKKLDL